MDRDIKTIPSPNLSSYYYYGFYEGLNSSTQFERGQTGETLLFLTKILLLSLFDHFKQRIPQEGL